MTTEEYIKENFDIQGLIEIGFLKDGMTIEQIDKNICTFFDIKTVFEYDFIMKPKVKEMKAEIKTFSSN